MSTPRAVSWWMAAAMIGVMLASPVLARDAAFVPPTPSGSSNADDAIKVEPKSEIDIGDSTINMARRTTLFFVNNSGAPIKVEKMAVNGDANVLAEIANDDCSKQGTIAPQSRCSVEVQVTPSSAGTWSVETLMTHNGPGRIARAKITGKTAGFAGGEKKENGLSVSSKEASPVTFGDVNVGSKSARSALMVNDSPDSITLYSIDVIEATNGLRVLDQGCAVDMELKSGESCPVTMIWEPSSGGQISTDLIIRHSGRLGFAVVPVRGNAKGDEKSERVEAPPIETVSKTKVIAPPPPTSDELEKAMAGKLPPVVDASLAKAVALPPAPTGVVRLIGTVGNRAVFEAPDGTTKVAGIDEEIALGDGKTAKVTAVNAKSAVILIDGKKENLNLGMSPDLVEKATIAAAAQKAKASGGGSNVSGSSSSSSSSKSSSSDGGSSKSAPTAQPTSFPGLTAGYGK